MILVTGGLKISMMLLEILGFLMEALILPLLNVLDTVIGL
jgi:hypothetical protein